MDAQYLKKIRSDESSRPPGPPTNVETANAGARAMGAGEGTGAGASTSKPLTVTEENARPGSVTGGIPRAPLRPEMSPFEFGNTPTGAVIRLTARSQDGVPWMLKIEHIASSERFPKSPLYIAREHERYLDVSRDDHKIGFLRIRDLSKTDFMDLPQATGVQCPKCIAVEMYRCAVPLCEMAPNDQEAAIGLVLEYVKAIQRECFQDIVLLRG